jgi:uracil-DNA glycosylase
MRPNNLVKCRDFPCSDINKDRCQIPDREIDPEKIKVVMVSEAPPQDAADYFYAAGNPFYLQTTVQAFKDAGFDTTSMEDVLSQGVYVTTAIKCPKIAYTISPQTIGNCCQRILEKEMDLFPRTKIILLMGDTAIKGMNIIAQRNTGKRVTPSGPAWKIRKNKYTYEKYGISPSYLQTGKSFLIDKSKREMIAEDTKAALEER